MGGRRFGRWSLLQHLLDEHHHVGDVDIAVAIHVAVGTVRPAGRGAVEHQFDEHGHVGDAHHTVTVQVSRLAQGHGLLDALFVIAQSLVDDLAVLDDVAKAAPLLILGIRVGAAGERRQQVAHVAAVEADTLDQIGQNTGTP